MTALLAAGDLVPWPDEDNIDEHGLLAVGGDLSVPTLQDAYAKGVFPWFSDDDPILWWCPHPRCIIQPHRSDGELQERRASCVA